MMKTAALVAALLVGGANAQYKQPVNYINGGLDWINGFNNGQPIAGNQCNGMNQSPINIVDGAVGPGAQFNAVYDPTLMPLQLKYTPQTNYTVMVTDNTLQLTYSSGAAQDGITVPVVGFVPVAQFHFHYPSEHLLNGAAWDLELHIVHIQRNAAGNITAIAVIGVVFAVSPDPTYQNTFIQGLLSVAPNAQTVANTIVLPGEQGTVDLDATVNIAGTGPTFNLMTDVFSGANTAKYYRYSGSLTTPPCLEGLYWHWLPTPLLISQTQLTQFTNLLAAAQGGISRGGDNRPTMPQNGRQVSKSFQTIANEVPQKKGKKGGRGLFGFF